VTETEVTKRENFFSITEAYLKRECIINRSEWTETEIKCAT